MKEQRGRKPRGTPTEFRLKTPDGNGNLICVGDTICNPDTYEKGIVTSLTKIKLENGNYIPLENDIYVIQERAIKISDSDNNKVIKEQKVDVVQSKKNVPSGPIFTGLRDIFGNPVYAGDEVLDLNTNQYGWINLYGLLVNNDGIFHPTTIIPKKIVKILPEKWLAEQLKLI